MSCKIAIHKDSLSLTHSGSWTYAWADYCQKNKIEYEYVDLFRCLPIKRLKDFQVFLWHIEQYNHAEMLEARSILYSAKKMGQHVLTTIERNI